MPTKVFCSVESPRVQAVLKGTPHEGKSEMDLDELYELLMSAGTPA